MKVLIVGAGGIGSLAARQLAERGHEVVLASRSGGRSRESSRVSSLNNSRGSSIKHDAAVVAQGTAAVTQRNTVITPKTPVMRATPVARVRLDAAAPGALTAAATQISADLVVNALNPPYTKWREAWPPIAAEFIRACEKSGAGLLTVGNLYSYGLVNGTMTEHSKVEPNGVKGMVRAQMWADALAAHQEGRIRAVELRASDYFGASASRGASYLNEYVIKPAIRAKTASPPMGNPDVLHSWTYLPDIAALIAAVAEADQQGSDWGRAWHVPSAAPRTMRQVAFDVCNLLGRDAVKVKPWANLVRSALKTVVPILRELDETAHQFERPFILDSTAAEARFGLRATDWSEALKTTTRELGR